MIQSINASAVKLTYVIEFFRRDLDKDANNLLAEAGRQGFGTFVIGDDSPYTLDDVAEQFRGKPTVLRSSMETALEYNGKVGSIPGSYFDGSSFSCSNYYHVFGSDIANHNAGWIPAKSILGHFGMGIPEGGLFFRPDSAYKYFEHRVVRSKKGLLDFAAYVANQCDSDPLVVYSTPKKIGSEFRILCVDGKAVTGSQYYEEGDKCEIPIDRDTHRDVFEFVDRIGNIALKLCGPAMKKGVFFVDVARVGNDWKVMEISPFSCASFYAIDLAKLVERVSRSALSLYHARQG